jgi:hypothetical protein
MTASLTEMEGAHMLVVADVLAHPIAGTLQKLVGLSDFAKSDETLARQLRRKFLV